jgi:DNA glycosylase AlkZ-like
VTEPVITRRGLNRALLARQLLLERASMPIPTAIEQAGGLQTQYAPSGYVGVWTRVRAFDRHALTAALEDRSVIQASLMRTTIHMVSRREFWPYAMGVRRARREWAVRARAVAKSEVDMLTDAERMRAALADGPRTVKELGELGTGFVGNLGLWVDLVRVPPSGTWERRRADRLALAESWVGPCDATEDDGLTHLVRAYLRAFGPAAWRDIASWAGISVTQARRGGEGLALASYRDEDGRPLIDLDGGVLPDADTPAPVRFLPHWDAVLLVHARRTGILPEPHRARIFSTRNPFSVGTYLVDGRVVGSWSLRDGRVLLDGFESLTAEEDRAVEREREALEAFHA